MAANKTHLKILTPKGVFYDKNVFSVLVATTEGQINFQHGKSEFVGNLVISQLSIKEENTSRKLEAAVSGGVVHAMPSQINIITEEIVWKDQIDLNKMEKARRILENKLQKNLPRAEKEKEELALKHILNQIKTKKS